MCSCKWVKLYLYSSYNLSKSTQVHYKCVITTVTEPFLSTPDLQVPFGLTGNIMAAQKPESKTKSPLNRLPKALHATVLGQSWDLVTT